MGRGGPRRPPVGPHGTRAHPAGRSRAPAAAYSRGPGLGAGPRGLLRRPLTGPAFCFPGVRPPGGAHLPAVLHLRPSCSAPHCTSGKLSPARSLARPLALQLLLFGVEFPTHFCSPRFHVPAQNQIHSCFLALRIFSSLQLLQYFLTSPIQTTLGLQWGTSPPHQ